MKRHSIGLLILSGILALAPLFGRSLSLSGSDLFDGDVGKALEAALRERDVEAEIRFEGSLIAEDELKNGQVEASLLAMPDEADGETSFRRYPVGFQLAVCAIHPANPVQALTYDELAEIFRSNGSINDWKDLTDDPEWSEQKLSLAAIRSEHSVALELFNAMVLRGQPLKRSVRILDSEDGSVPELIADESGALVLTPWVPGESSEKYIAVRPETGTRGYTPSKDNVFFGDYPLRLPFYLTVSPDLDPGTIKVLLKTIYSGPVSAALSKAGCMPLPESEQRAIIASLD
ncbi:MAG: hypothetical protein R6V45_02335 [Oceanipulchritudo sp.]